MGIGTLNELTGIMQGGNALINAFADISQSDFVSQQFLFNENIAKIQSEEAITQGKFEQTISQERTAQLSGQQQAAEGAQGADVHTGTAAVTREQTSTIGGLDYLTIGNNAFLKSLGYKIEGENAKTEAWQTKAAGENKAENSLLGGAEEMFQSHIKALSYDQPKVEQDESYRPQLYSSDESILAMQNEGL